MYTIRHFPDYGQHFTEDHGDRVVDIYPTNKKTAESFGGCTVFVSVYSLRPVLRFNMKVIRQTATPRDQRLYEI